ncbi:hypothetical protein E2562_035111 [Oryza meyeriana var. granulata]|uniref:Pentacotripeptide-repeat region of PRORP domain-containing protein n=1 Tax=Oryza meyeriana var. granulata TaxID=110450 RepID=A0A6G1FFR6_9ORYZ|nr:hypothetical protein E2562_035111 [Oryza meyeriana var. granulata]
MAAAALPGWWALPFLRAPSSSAARALSSVATVAGGHDLPFLRTSSAVARAFSSSIAAVPGHQQQQKAPTSASATTAPSHATAAPITKQREGQPTPNKPRRMAANPLLFSLARVGHVKQAIKLLRQGVPANCEVFYELAASCSSPRLKEQLNDVHHYFLCSGLHSDTRVNNKLIEMYPKCDLLEFSRRTFDHMDIVHRDLYPWLVMIKVYYEKGEFEAAFILFQGLRSSYYHDTKKTNQLVSPVGSSDLVSIWQGEEGAEASRDGRSRQLARTR